MSDTLLESVALSCIISYVYHRKEKEKRNEKETAAKGRPAV